MVEAEMQYVLEAYPSDLLVMLTGKFYPGELAEKLLAPP